MQRPLWETIVDVVSAVAPPQETEGLIRITGLSLDLPLEVVARQTAGGGIEILADVPRWRWTTDFDLPLGRLRLRCGDREDDAG